MADHYGDAELLFVSFRPSHAVSRIIAHRAMQPGALQIQASRPVFHRLRDQVLCLPQDGRDRGDHVRCRGGETAEPEGRQTRPTSISLATCTSDLAN